MAVPAWPSTSVFGPFAADDWTVGSCTAIYIYAVGVSEAEMARLIGYRDKDGTLVDGDFTNQIQARNASDDAADLGQDRGRRFADVTWGPPLPGAKRSSFRLGRGFRASPLFLENDMAVLSDADRKAAWVRWMRENRAEVPISKVELRAAIDAVDQWVDDNAVGYNQALPVAARSGLTATQKARLLWFVVKRRFEVGA
jgi:hypothetical protein